MLFQLKSYCTQLFYQPYPNWKIYTQVIALLSRRIKDSTLREVILVLMNWRICLLWLLRTYTHILDAWVLLSGLVSRKLEGYKIVVAEKCSRFDEYVQTVESRAELLHLLGEMATHQERGILVFRQIAWFHELYGEGFAQLKHLRLCLVPCARLDCTL